VREKLKLDVPEKAEGKGCGGPDPEGIECPSGDPGLPQKESNRVARKRASLTPTTEWANRSNRAISFGGENPIERSKHRQRRRNRTDALDAGKRAAVGKLAREEREKGGRTRDREATKRTLAEKWWLSGWINEKEGRTGPAGALEGSPPGQKKRAAVPVVGESPKGKICLTLNRAAGYEKKNTRLVVRMGDPAKRAAPARKGGARSRRRGKPRPARASSWMTILQERGREEDGIGNGLVVQKGGPVGGASSEDALVMVGEQGQGEPAGPACEMPDAAVALQKPRAVLRGKSTQETDAT